MITLGMTTVKVKEVLRSFSLVVLVVTWRSSLCRVEVRGAIKAITVEIKAYP